MVSPKTIDANKVLNESLKKSKSKEQSPKVI